MAYMDQLEPHNTKKTLSINEARTKINLLVKPIGDRIRNIYSNMEHVESEIAKSDAEAEILKSKLHIMKSKLVPVKLAFPRTVCTNEKCKIRKPGASGGTHKKYKVCDRKCLCGFIGGDEVGDKRLLLCWAFDMHGACKNCIYNCSYSKHMRIYYKQKIISYLQRRRQDFFSGGGTPWPL